MSDTEEEEEDNILDNWKLGTVVFPFKDGPTPLDKYMNEGPGVPRRPGFYVVYSECAGRSKVGVARNLDFRLKSYTNMWPDCELYYLREWPSQAHVIGEDNNIRSRQNEYEKAILKFLSGLEGNGRLRKTEYFQGRPTADWIRAIENLDLVNAKKLEYRRSERLKRGKGERGGQPKPAKRMKRGDGRLQAETSRNIREMRKAEAEAKELLNRARDLRAAKRSGKRLRSR